MSLTETLLPFQNLINKKLENSINYFGPKSRLRDAIEYALKNGGKRVRPALVYIVAKALDPLAPIDESALAVEFFHTASLIADDLPCMDNEETRRGMPCLHNAFEENTALLASYALIAAGYEAIRMNAQMISNGSQRLAMAIESASYNMGILGATGGQFYDLYISSNNEEKILEALEKKTAPFFELSFVLGWLFGGGELDLLEEVKQAARHFGKSFQMSDDLLDLEEDRKSGALNYANILGVEKARRIFQTEIGCLEEALKKLRLDVPELQVFVSFIKDRS